MANAKRPIFSPTEDKNKLFDEKNISFEWFLGMNISVKQKSIESFHENAAQQGFDRVLEISTYSNSEFGCLLSAFNLEFSLNGRTSSVERLYQSAKVLETEHEKQGESAKGKVPHGFVFDGMTWPLSPPTAFYDWLYLNALLQHPDLISEIMKYNAFTDIAFNPKKSLNCQARSAAIFVTLTRRNLLSNIKDQKTWLTFLEKLEFKDESLEGIQQPSLGMF